MARVVRLACFDLDEDDGAAIQCHQVEFAAADAIAPGQDFVAAAEVFQCCRLAAHSPEHFGGNHRSCQRATACRTLMEMTGMGFPREFEAQAAMMAENAAGGKQGPGSGSHLPAGEGTVTSFSADASLTPRGPSGSSPPCFPGDVARHVVRRPDDEAAAGSDAVDQPAHLVANLPRRAEGESFCTLTPPRR